MDDTPSWYATAQLADLEAWDDQDPDIYRAMAAPRPCGGAVSADVQIIDDDDDDYVFDGEALSSMLDSMLDLEADPNGYDDLDDLDALESLNPFDLSPSFLEDAGLLPDNSIVPLDAEAVHDPPTPLADAFIAPLDPIDQELPGALLSLPPGVLSLVPVYESHCSTPSTSAAAGTELQRQRPARIARRLWQRDMEKLAS